jgi:hypothetical protein
LLAAEGMKLGRPVGGAKNLKLDKHADKIDGYLAKGINKVAIAKLLDVSPNTLYEWLKVRRPTVSLVHTCRIPDDCIDSKRYPLFMAREVMRQLIDNHASPQQSTREPCHDDCLA